MVFTVTTTTAECTVDKEESECLSFVKYMLGNKKNSLREKKYRILRNVFVLGLAFMLHFTAYQGVAYLQSSINEGLGQASLVAIYAALIVSSVFLPVAFINRFGCKWALALSIMLYVPYIAAQFYPCYWTLIPTGILVGVGAGPLWCAKCTYLSVAADSYSILSNVPSDVLVVRFFGIFFMMFNMANVWGNYISSSIFSRSNLELCMNSTEDNVEENCGASFCPKTSQIDDEGWHNSREVDLLSGIYLCFIILASVVICLGIDALGRYGKMRSGNGEKLKGIQLLLITIDLLKEPNQILMIPITMWLGFSQAFMGADFTKSFVTCSLGVRHIGYVMLCFGLCNSISAISTAWLVKYTGRVPLVLTAMTLHITTLATMLVWRPKAEEKMMFFILSGLYGLCDGVWLVQINAYCGILFPGQEEAAYSHFRLWESIGFIISYSYSAFLCTYVKIYIIMVMLGVSVACYVIVELKEHFKAKERTNS